MEYDINKILDKIESENLSDLINERKKDKLLSTFNIPFFDNLIASTSNNIKVGSCFEICGPTCTGKTEILIHIIVKVLIDNLEINECSTSSNIEKNDNQIYILNRKYSVKYKLNCESIYFYDCNSRFNFSRLLKILKFQLLKVLLSQNSNNTNSNFYQKENIDIKQIINDGNAYNVDIPIKMCLKYFNLIRPSNTFSLIVSLIHLKDFYSTVSYVMIDSISMFYFIDMEEEVCRRNINEKKKYDNILSSTSLYRQLNKLLKLLSQKYKINLFLTTRYHNKEQYNNNNNNNEDISIENPTKELINSLYYSLIKNNKKSMEYFFGLQNNQLIYKNLMYNNYYYHQEYSVYQEDLINFKILISRHPSNLLEIPTEFINQNEYKYINTNQNINDIYSSKFVCCLIRPLKSNILEFKINEFGIEDTL